MPVNTPTYKGLNQQEKEKEIVWDQSNIDQQDKKNHNFSEWLKKEKEKQTKKQDYEILALKEKLFENNLWFLKRLEASPVGRNLLLKIKEKRNELLPEMNIEQYKEFLPHCIQHWLPIQVVIGDRTSKDSLELENYLKKFDAIVANMKASEIEMIKSLVTVIKFWRKGSFDRVDGSLEIRELSKLKLNLRAVFEHEFTHLKEFYLSIVDPEFHSKLEKINSDIDMSNLDVVNVGLWRPIWKSEVREYYPGIENEQGELLRKIILKDGKIIECFIFELPWSRVWTYVNDQLLTPEIQNDLIYRSSLTAPKDWFINSYAKSNGGSNELLLGEFIRGDIKYQEQLTTITETYYDDPAYFAELFFQSKAGESIPLNQKYDHLSDFPALRKKLRLMIEYGFFPDGEFSWYIEEE